MKSEISLPSVMKGDRMAKKILIDTNIMLDFAIEGRPGHDAAEQLIDRVGRGCADAYVCATSLKDIYYVLVRHMGEADARAYVRALIESFYLCSVDHGICKEAVMCDEADFEDAIVRICAEHVPVDYIISRNEGAFEHSHIKRFSAAQYVYEQR